MGFVGFLAPVWAHAACVLANNRKPLAATGLVPGDRTRRAPFSILVHWQVYAVQLHHCAPSAAGPEDCDDRYFVLQNEHQTCALSAQALPNFKISPHLLSLVSPRRARPDTSHTRLASLHLLLRACSA